MIKNYKEPEIDKITIMDSLMSTIDISDPEFTKNIGNDDDQGEIGAG